MMMVLVLIVDMIIIKIKNKYEKSANYFKFLALFCLLIVRFRKYNIYETIEYDIIKLNVYWHIISIKILFVMEGNYESSYKKNRRRSFN